jgi:hypothetical protein
MLVRVHNLFGGRRSAGMMVRRSPEVLLDNVTT